METNSLVSEFIGIKQPCYAKSGFCPVGIEESGPSQPSVKVPFSISVMLAESSEMGPAFCRSVDNSGGD